MARIGAKEKDYPKIIEKLNKHKLIVKTLPSISEIVDGRITISDIKDLNIDDLLNRKQVKPDLNLLTKNISSKKRRWPNLERFWLNPPASPPFFDFAKICYFPDSFSVSRCSFPGPKIQKI